MRQLRLLDLPFTTTASRGAPCALNKCSLAPPGRFRIDGRRVLFQSAIILLWSRVVVVVANARFFFFLSVAWTKKEE